MELLYRDEALAAFHKPAGLLMHRSAIDRHATRFALQEARDILGQRVYPVHRLDKPTSGVLLFALDRGVAGRLTLAFTTGRVRKAYRAVVRGFTAVEGVCHHPLGEMLDPMTDRRADLHKAPQPAATAYRRLATVELPHAVGPYATPATPSSRPRPTPAGATRSGAT